MQMRLKWRLAALIGAVAVIASGAVWVTHRAPAVHYVTAPVTRGDVITTLTASGSVNPVVTVEVGNLCLRRDRVAGL